MVKKIGVLDYIFCAFILLIVAIGVKSHFFEPSLPEDDIFYKFYSNKGIQLFGKIFMILYTITGIALLFSIIKREFNRSRLVILLISLFLIIAGGWFFMWYTSTFYYGEFKQVYVTSFPTGELFYSFYFISLLPIKETKYNWLKWVICIATTALFIGVFELVKEPWHLWSSGGYFF